MSNLVIIAGPTGSGKTGLACALDPDLFEVVSFDSRQIYQELEIGTAKPTLVERNAIRHHLIDIVSPDTKLNAAVFCEMANQAVEKILHKNKTPVIVCGTGFYLKAFLYGMYPVPEIPDETRKKVLDMSLAQKVELLASIDSAALQILSANDEYRIGRALEVNLSGSLWSGLKETATGYIKQKKPEITGILLSMPRDTLYQKINKRSQKMIAEGMVEETILVMDKYGKNCPGLQTIGYNFALELIQGNTNLETFQDKLAQSHRNYAKKQITWFKKESILESFHPDQAILELKKTEKRLKDVSKK